MAQNPATEARRYPPDEYLAESGRATLPMTHGPGIRQNQAPDPVARRGDGIRSSPWTVGYTGAARRDDAACFVSAAPRRPREIHRPEEH
jgi:hypothetical protein